MFNKPVRSYIFILLLAALVMSACLHPGFIQRLQWKGLKPATAHAAVLRKFPYPYRAAVTITSDADSCSREECLEIHQFLNTTEDTSRNAVPGRDTRMGEGVGLELGDSFFPFTDYHTGGWTFTYFTCQTTSPSLDADLIRTYARAGYADVMHSFGDIKEPAYFKRSMALAALDEFKRAGLGIMVFTNHGGPVNTNNIGPAWLGDKPASAGYHTDRSLQPRGPIRFISDGTCTTTLGFDPPLHPLTLRDGAKVWGFPRYYNPQEGWTVDYLDKQLSAAHLDEVERREGYWIVANHLGMTKGGGNQMPVFNAANREALRELARRTRAGRIYTTNAAKLLTYAQVHMGLMAQETQDNSGNFVISIQGVNDPVAGSFVPSLEQLQGITFYTEQPKRTRVMLAGRDVTAGMQFNPADASGRPSLGFPLTHLPPLPEWTIDGATAKTEDYRVNEYNYTFSVTNLGDAPVRPTLSYIGLHPFAIREVRVGGKLWGDVPDARHVRLPILQPGETLAGIRVMNGA